MKIGFVSLPLSGHLYPMTALARRLRSRGHEIVFIGVPDIEPIVLAAGLTFIPYCEEEYPLGSIAAAYAPVAKLHGLAVIEYTVREIGPGILRAAYEHLAQKLAEVGVEALVLDILHSFLELVPMSLGIPYVHVWNTLHLDGSGSTPPMFFSWPHESTSEALFRNIEGLKSIGSFFAPMRPVAMFYADRSGLTIDWTDPTATISKLAVITQTPQEFDFPDCQWPPHFHYAGPFHDNEGRELVSFEWRQLSSEPLIYISLGTLVNGMDHMYKTILQAGENLSDLQMVLSVGSNVDLDDLGKIPSNVVVVRKAPQLELLKRAALCVTHAGLNTTLEALANGVPIVAVPIAYDQPGVAARIAYHGVGEFLNLEDLTAGRLSGMIRKVLENPSYRERAAHFQKVIADGQGLNAAVDAIDYAFQIKSQWGQDNLRGNHLASNDVLN